MKRAKQIKDPKTKNNIKIKQQPLSLRHRDQNKNNSHWKNVILKNVGQLSTYPSHLSHQNLPTQK